MGQLLAVELGHVFLNTSAFYLSLSSVLFSPRNDIYPMVPFLLLTPWCSLLTRRPAKRNSYLQSILCSNCRFSCLSQLTHILHFLKHLKLFDYSQNHVKSNIQTIQRHLPLTFPFSSYCFEVVHIHSPMHVFILSFNKYLVYVRQCSNLWITMVNKTELTIKKKR